MIKKYYFFYILLDSIYQIKVSCKYFLLLQNFFLINLLGTILQTNLLCINMNYRREEIKSALKLSIQISGRQKGTLWHLMQLQTSPGAFVIAWYLHKHQHEVIRMFQVHESSGPRYICQMLYVCHKKYFFKLFLFNYQSEIYYIK